MAVLEVKTYPNPVLNEISGPVTHLTEEDRRFISDLIETMYQYDGVGIAAPQVGILRRMIVVSPKAIRGTESVYINPEILSEEGSETGVEGCLSVPGISGEVKRAKKVTLRASDLGMKEFTVRAEGLEARIIQHEIDHLNGKLFIDRVGFKQRQELISSLRVLNKM